MGPSGRITRVIEYIGYILLILDYLGQDMQVLYLGRAPRTKETLPDFLKWHRVTRRPLVFRGLTGSQRTPGFWASHSGLAREPYPRGRGEIRLGLPRVVCKCVDVFQMSYLDYLRKGS